MTASENAEIESASDRPADYSVRYSTRTMLIVMAVVAVLCAIFAPRVRDLNINAQISLAVLWGSAFLMSIPHGWRAWSRRCRFLRRHQYAVLIVRSYAAGSKWRAVLKVGCYLFVPILLSIVVIREENPPPGGWGMFAIFNLVIIGYLMGAYLVGLVFDWFQPVSLQETSIYGFKKPIPWTCIRGIRETKHPGTFLLRRYDGDLRLTVKPVEREAFLALVKEKTGHQL